MDAVCKKQFTARGYTREQYRSRLKLWLLAGMTIDGPAARIDHVQVQPKDMEDVPEAEADARLAALGL